MCNRYTAISVGRVCNKRTHSLGSVFVRSCAQSRRWFTRAKCRLRERINRALQSATGVTTVIVIASFQLQLCLLYSPQRMQQHFYFAKKCGGKGKFPQAQAPAVRSLTLRYNILGTFTH